MQVHELSREQDEASFVARKIERLMGGTRFESLHGEEYESVKSFGDIAVLYRVHYLGHHVKKELDRRGIPCRLAATRSIYEEPVIQTIVAVLQVIENPGNDGAVESLLTDSPYSTGDSSAEALRKEARAGEISLFAGLRSKRLLHKVTAKGRDRCVRLSNALEACSAAAGLPLDRLIRTIHREFYPGEEGIETDSLLALITSAIPFSHVPARTGIPFFLKKIGLLQEGEVLATSGEGVQLMTVHGAKGLEFPAVFIIGMEQGMFPYWFGGADTGCPASQEEERRLFYVAMTRAKDMLHITHVRSRYFFGKRQTMEPSVFLSELPADCIQKKVIEKKARTSRKGSQQMKLFG